MRRRRKMFWQRKKGGRRKRWLRRRKSGGRNGRVRFCSFSRSPFSLLQISSSTRFGLCDEVAARRRRCCASLFVSTFRSTSNDVLDDTTRICQRRGCVPHPFENSEIYHRHSKRTRDFFYLILYLCIKYTYKE